MTMLSRRQWLQSASAALGALMLAQLPLWPRAAPAQPQPGPFTLPPLPYANNALMPAIDARTMEIHHDRHHQAYVTGLNNAVAGNANLSAMTIDAILRNIAQVPQAIQQAVINNGGGHYNHSMFWQIMGPNLGGNPAGNLAAAINARFTNFDTFKMQFKTACLSRFGSGWAWLVYRNNQLDIISTANQDCPLMTAGTFPVFGLDVWEHAYYLHYQNRRNDYVDAWWTVANWPAIGQRFARAMAGG